MSEKKEPINKAIITVIGKDKPGIVASISAILAENNINIRDISHSFPGDLFSLIFIVDLSGSKISLNELSKQLNKKGEEMHLSIKIQHEDVFKAMHRI